VLRIRSDSRIQYKLTFLNSIRSSSQSPKNVPYWQLYNESAIKINNSSLNSKAVGNCKMTCQTQSKNCTKTGDLSSLCWFLACPILKYVNITFILTRTNFPTSSRSKFVTE
jgi:hypothetical protein